MRIYISGKIGEEFLSEATRQKFQNVESRLRKAGHEVFNPTTSGLGKTADESASILGTTFYKEIMLLDLRELTRCDAIYMLPDYKTSPGAMAELYFAKAIGLQIIYSNE